MQISIIAALTDNYVLGKDNKLIWHLPDDLKNFKRLTSGHPIIMGRKTFESLGKPLPNRTNIVITRNSDMHLTGCLVAHSLKEALQMAQNTGCEVVFVIGGGEIYHQTLPLANVLYLTHVHTTLAGDAFFPQFAPEEWEKTESIHHPVDEKHAFSFEIATWKRRLPKTIE